ncbi:quercetin 2,3-dioxygenase family protein [Allorhizobium sp. BGMRC 0089]|uniref:cupin domain-containing protein n=1 Tax=Allorhizobium sonneratiae TaxID=2934936 RepID=UPI00203352CD|nr:quercetin 2,3-dioxygenase family protein [Allorhizobium sonneratiae]MCM2293893.1 quercetin 2,3-dioxygenase family protein [Allorhizobium sonneratiae]
MTQPQTSSASKAAAYILRQGEGETYNVAGQIIRVLAGCDETNGGYGAVVCEATLDRQPIPLHFHEREHDTWFCTRGRLRIWANGLSRILTEGDFAYVRPYDVHSYQSVAPRTQFFGIVAPGGWEGFFESAGSPWTEPGLPPQNHPFDFARMGMSMERYRIMRVPEQVYAEASSGDGIDCVLPDTPCSYVLQAGHGKRRRLAGHLSTQILAPALCDGQVDMRTIEAGRGATQPALMHETTHVTLYVLEGQLSLSLNGRTETLQTGDFANIPAGTVYATSVISGTARWLLSAANGNGLAFWDELGTPTEEFTFSPADGEDLAQRMRTDLAADVKRAD